MANRRAGKNHPWKQGAWIYAKVRTVEDKVMGGYYANRQDLRRDGALAGERPLLGNRDRKLGGRYASGAE